MTFILNSASLSAAVRTGTLRLHHAEDSALGLGDHTATVTMGACLGLAIAGTTAATCLAGHIFTHFDLLLTTAVNLFKCQLDLDTKIGAAQHTPCRTATTAETCKACAETAAKQVAEDTSKLREDVVHIHTTLTVCSVDTGMAELIVACFLVRIAQHIISLGSFLELLLSFLVARIAVRVILQGQFAVGLL